MEVKVILSVDWEAELANSINTIFQQSFEKFHFSISYACL